MQYMSNNRKVLLHMSLLMIKLNFKNLKSNYGFYPLHHAYNDYMLSRSSAPPPLISWQIGNERTVCSTYFDINLLMIKLHFKNFKSISFSFYFRNMNICLKHK